MLITSACNSSSQVQSTGETSKETAVETTLSKIESSSPKTNDKADSRVITNLEYEYMDSSEMLDKLANDMEFPFTGVGWHRRHFPVITW